MKQVTTGAYVLPFGGVNGVLLDAGGELALIDTGYPNQEHLVWDAVEQLGRKREDIRHLVLTHAHRDHIGSAAAIVRETGATTYMSAVDAPLAETGGPFRPMTPSPQLVPRLLYPFVWKPEIMTERFQVDRRIADGDVLPIVGGLKVVATPGHSAGQVALLWQGERLLIAGDVGMNFVGLSDPIGFEDPAAGRRSQERIAGLHFDTAVFGHGRPILAKASDQIRKRWA